MVVERRRRPEVGAAYQDFRPGENDVLEDGVRGASDDVG